MESNKKIWGEPIRFHGHHYTDEYMDSMRKKVDLLADNALNKMGPSEILGMLADEEWKSKHLCPELLSFVENVCQVPPWINWGKVRRGQLVFLKYASSACMGLLYYSLIGGFSAPKIVKVLDETSYLTVDTNRTWTRLNETLEMVIDCLDDGSLNIGGRGWRSVIKVRLIHSHVRAMILKKGLWDDHAYGLPINQEDMVATLLSFSINVLTAIKKVVGPLALTREDEDSYIHLWRVIGFYMGVSEDHNPCTNVETASGAIESIVIHLLHPDRRSGELARHVIRSIASRPPFYWSYETHSQAARYLLGPQLAGALGIEYSFFHYIYVSFILLFIQFFSLAISFFVTSDGWFIERVRNALRKQINVALKKSSKSK